jgi:exopolysaccharide biosynthesis predicted pyruvyltransferase EpsI
MPETRPTNPDAPLLFELRDRIDSELAAVLNGARDVALVNFPNHGNPGDPAIWLGTEAALRRLGVRVRYRCAWCTYHPEALRRALPEGPVLINGGGNFGDLYAGQQGLRERLLVELAGRRLIQLPQSIHFTQRANLERMRKLVADHGDVTLLVREARSEALAREHFDVDIRLLPDMALALGPMPPVAAEPLTDILWLHRNADDKEYVDHGPPPEGVATRQLEWLGTIDPEPVWTPRQRLARKVNARLLERCRTDPRWARHAWRPLAATFGPLGAGWVQRGVAILGYGRVLVTDKLHGHLLAELAGFPHIVMDNSYGKVSATYETWTRRSTLARWAHDGDEARALAVELLNGTGS